MLLVFYGFFGTLALTGVVAAYRFARRWGRAAAVMIAAGVAAAVGLVFPVPVHGGLTCLLEVAVDELTAAARRVENMQERAAEHAFVTDLEERFAAPLRLRTLEAYGDGWSRVADESGAEGWLESGSGLVWQGPLSWETAPAEPSLAEAQAFCGAQLPAGRWALPTEGELLALWRAGGQTHMPGDGRSSLAVNIDAQTRTRLRTRFGGRGRGFSLRCVARSEAAPRRGYLSEDFPLEDRNRFQLQKAELYR